MSYERVGCQSIRYVVGNDTPVQFGADGEAKSYAFIGPPGKKGLVRDIEVRITEDMVGTTTVPEIGVGDAASDLGSLDNEYARFRLGSTAILGYTTSSFTSGMVRASSLVDGYPNAVGAATLPGRQSTNYAEHVVLEKAFIAADAPFFISLVPGSGGSETGAGMVAVEIDWF
jgi:hypothetical protein